MARKTGSDVRASLDKEYADRKKEYGGYEKYEVEGWVRSLEEAAAVLSDPAKMKQVAKCMAKKEDATELLKGLVAGRGKLKPQDRDD